MRDPYAVLGISPGADAKSVRRAYKKLAVANHPDRNPDPQAAERFKEIAAAYAVLTNARERRRYVRQRRREHAAQEELRRERAAQSRRRAAALRSQAAAAAEQVFWEYARQVRERRRQAHADSRKAAGRPGGIPQEGNGGWVQRLGAVAAVLLTAVYVWRSAHGLPLQPWLPAGTFATHPLHSPIWITLSLALLMVVQPRWFLVPILIDGPRDARLAGWAMLLTFPLVSAGLLHVDRLMQWAQQF